MQLVPLNVKYSLQILIQKKFLFPTFWQRIGNANLWTGSSVNVQSEGSCQNGEKESLWLPWPGFKWELPGFVADVPVAVFFPHWKQSWPCRARQGCQGTDAGQEAEVPPRVPFWLIAPNTLCHPVNQN